MFRTLVGEYYMMMMTMAMAMATTMTLVGFVSFLAVGSADGRSASKKGPCDKTRDNGRWDLDYHLFTALCFYLTEFCSARAPQTRCM